MDAQHVFVLEGTRSSGAQMPEQTLVRQMMGEGEGICTYFHKGTLVHLKHGSGVCNYVIGLI